MVVVLVLVVLVVLEAGSDKTITAELKLAVFSNPPFFFSCSPTRRGAGHTKYV
jgi:hypothetical protein